MLISLNKYYLWKYKEHLNIFRHTLDCAIMSERDVVLSSVNSIHDYSLHIYLNAQLDMPLLFKDTHKNVKLSRKQFQIPCFYFEGPHSPCTSGLAVLLVCTLTQPSWSVAPAGCCRRAICGSGETSAKCLLYSPGVIFGSVLCFASGPITVFVAMLCGGFSGLS